MTSVISIYCLIEDKGKILLTEDVGKGGWKLPGGKLEKGEMLFDAARREVKEETGYEVEVTGLICIHEYKNKDGTHRLRFYTTAKLVGGEEKRMEGEVASIEWVDKKKVEKMKRGDFYIEPYYLAVREYFEGGSSEKSLITNIS